MKEDHLQDSLHSRQLGLSLRAPTPDLSVSFHVNRAPLQPGSFAALPWSMQKDITASVQTKPQTGCWALGLRPNLNREVAASHFLFSLVCRIGQFEATKRHCKRSFERDMVLGAGS